MSETLLRTKLFVPPLRPNRVPRLRLIEQLNQGLKVGHKLTLISAPAGFGKTTLASEWVENSRLHAANESQIDPRIAWLSLDESHNDPARFLDYMIAALNQVEGIETSIGTGALAMIQSPQLTPTEDVLISVINDITAIPHRIVLILDDYHMIDSLPVDDAITFLLEHLPPQMHLLIATRDDPQLPLARLRVRGQLSELRAADLRFTAVEAAEFLNQVMGLDLSAEDIATLETRTEGWIAGLELAAISMQGHEDTASLIKTFTGSHRFVLDYLLEEVLEQQPATVQTFLLQTAVLDRMTGPLCDALTGQGNGRATLEMLEHANLFIIPLDDERRWYRYHRLFSDLLRRRLRQTQLEQLPILHIRASEWNEQNGFTDEAIEHALQAGNFERAAHRIEEHIDDIWQLDEHTKLRRWLDGLPDDVIFSKPHLCILHAGNLFARGHIEEAEQRLQAADQALNSGAAIETDAALIEQNQPLDPDKKKLRGRAAVIRSHLDSYQGDHQGAIQNARWALEYLPMSDSTWRSSAFDSMGTVYSSTDVASAFQARSDALQASKAAGNAYMILYASLRLVVTLRDLARLQQAIEICQQQLELANKSGLSQTALVGWLFTLWAEVLAEKNELDRALQLANKGMALTEQGKDVILLGSSYLCLMRVLFSRGDMQNAQEIIQKANNFTPKQELSPWITTQLAAWQARIWLAQDELDSASHWAEECEPHINGELTSLHDFDYVVLARVLITQGRLDESSRLLRRLFEAAEAAGCTSKVIEILILQALAFKAGGNTVRAVTTLGKALTLAEPGGFIRIFVDEGPPMTRLLHEAVSRGIALDYTRQLLAAFSPATAEQAGPPNSQIPKSEFVEPLSERELELLQRIAEGLSNREIADRLYLSLNTVKAHTRNIYGKLGVHSRTQAVARARALGLLPSI